MAEPYDLNDMGEAPTILLGGEDTMEEDEAIPLAPSNEIHQMASSDELISKIIASPYPHHITGPTSSRFRNALSRITTNPYDVEAWQALMTEANACWRAIQPAVHNIDSDTHARLDWIESCYGNLLKHFPYATTYWETVVEMLLAQSARMGEEGGPYIEYGPSLRARQSEAKLERIFRDIMGVEMDGTPTKGSILGGMCTSSVELWLLYVKKRIRDATRQPIAIQEEKIKFVREKAILAYEVALEHTSFVHSNHVIWKQYLAYVKAWIPNPALNTDHALAQKQMVHLRSIYKRLVTHPMLGLDQLWQEYELFERGQNEALAAALIAEYAPKYQHARNVYLDRNRVYTTADLQMNRLATLPVDIDDEDYAVKMVEEHRLLSMWKRRCAYERTNPERLGQEELVRRIRQAYKDFVCTCTRHPEAWHMWSTWELLQPTSKDAAKAECAIAVLQSAQFHIGDCTLLAHAESQVLELHSDQPAQCLTAMERFLEKCPNTLGFVLYQQMVRRYKGIEEARAVFAKARRVLQETSTKDEKQQTESIEEAKKDDEEEVGATTSVVAADNGKRRMVTNRLDPSVGIVPKVENGKDLQLNGESNVDEESTAKVAPGPVTWQLYASHAAMEHRLNHAPAIAARVYELGLRKHTTFLTKAPYIMRYAQLLLELQDTDNLRALLTRAVAACDADGSKGDTAAALWDMTLRFESILSGADPRNMSALKNVERRRHAALFGADIEDVATGGLLSGADVIQIGGQKTSISEQLVRAEGYDTSSSIVSGMSRAISVLEVMGLWGNDVSVLGRRKKQYQSTDADDFNAGGKSDASFQRRLNYQNLLEAGESTEAVLGADTTSKFSSARERLVGAGGGGPSSAAALAIQQSPEWLRSLLNLLPASRLRTAILGKPPPHLVEMALSALRSSVLPAERPADEGNGAVPRKRQLEDGDDSDDDEDMRGGGGYGSQFRARQKARLSALVGHSNGA